MILKHEKTKQALHLLWYVLLWLHPVNILITQLDPQFVNSELNVFGIVYSQFCMYSNAYLSFSLHMAIIKKHYCEAKKVKPSLVQVAEPLDVTILDLQMCIFKLTMKTQAPKAMVEPFDINLATKLWVTINNNVLFTQRLNDYLKLAEIIVVSMFKFVKNEWTFSMFAFMKDKLCNKLGLHLDTIVHMFAQEFYIQKSFPYQEAIIAWKD